MRAERWIRRWGPVSGVALVAALLVANQGRGAAPDATSSTHAAPSANDSDSYLVVDCALPAKIRRLGRNTNYLAPRQPVRTTALDCAIRGGEYTAYDRASYQTSRAVWQASADEGSAEAQYYLGRMYEKGLGASAPDYPQAAMWYRKAADQSYIAAEVSLGYLYEKGLGVDPDSVAAMKWYRKSAGLAENVVLMPASEVEQLRAAQIELRGKQTEIDALERQVLELDLRAKAVVPPDNRERDAAEAKLAALGQAMKAQRARVAQLEAQLVANASQTTAAPSSAAKLDFGPYYALLIGNGSYAHLPGMPAAPGEAKDVAAVLERRYGFKVRVLVDATRYQIMTAFNELRESLNEKYNLLVYYAGRSQEESASQRGWWLPVDAEADSRANWISLDVISDHLDLIPAKHALVVANAAFPALLTRSALAQLPRGATPEGQLSFVRQTLAKRSRLVLTAGEAPVNAAAAANPACESFGKAFVDALAEGGPVLEASALQRRIATRLAESCAAATVPQFAPLRWASHQGGAEFFFVVRGH